MSSPPSWQRESPEPHEVSEDIIRRAFNEGQLWERAQKGQLVPLVRRDSHPDTPPQQEPRCTRSQIIVYHTVDGEPVALVHQYLRPDGTLGGSGKPDPKRLVVGDRIIFVRSRPGQSGSG